MTTTKKALSTRARKTKGSQNEEASKLIEALKFISIAQSKAGTPYQTHCVIKDGYIFGFDGTVTVGTPLNIDLQCCPHTYNLMQALSNCGADLTVTNETLNLTIKSGRYKSVIECYPMEKMVVNAPDDKFIQVTDNIKTGLSIAAKVAGGQAAITNSILLKGNVLAATDRFALVEYWHGYEGIPPVLVPKRTAEFVAGCPKSLTHIGGSSHSVTFHFDDGSFIRSGLVDGQYPNYDSILAFDGVALPPPAEFFEAAEKIGAFTESGQIYFTKGKVCSRITPELGSSYDIDNLPEDVSINSKYLNTLKQCISIMSMHTNERGFYMYFFGDNVRGVITGMTFGEN